MWLSKLFVTSLYTALDEAHLYSTVDVEKIVRPIDWNLIIFCYIDYYYNKVEYSFKKWVDVRVW